MNERDSFVQEPKTSWAIWIVILVVILFGAFWYTQSSKDTPKVPQPIAHTPSPLDTIQATVINSSIPDYSSQF